MRWIKGNIELEENMVRVPIKVHIADGFYYCLGTYVWDDDQWWDINRNATLDSDTIEFLDETPEPDSNRLWDRVQMKVMEDSEENIWIPEDILCGLKNEYHLIRK